MICRNCKAEVTLPPDEQSANALYWRELALAERKRGDDLLLEIGRLRTHVAVLESVEVSCLRQIRQLKKQAQPEPPYIHRVKRSA